MTNSEFIMAALHKGILVSPSLLKNLDNISEGKILDSNPDAQIVICEIPSDPKPLKKTRRPSKTSKTKDPEKKTETKPDEKTREEISIETNMPTKPKELEPADFVKYYNSKFERIRDMISKKTNAISINKIAGMTGRVTVIGMVKEKNPNNLLIEDQTGEIMVEIGETAKDIFNDDVIALSGVVKGGVLRAERVIVPDVPLTHSIGKTDGKILLILSKDENINGYDAVITPECAWFGNNTLMLENPASISLKKTNGMVRLVIYRPSEPTGLEKAIFLLRKRHLSPHPKEIAGPDDPFLLDSIPDILWIISDERFEKTYKGVSVISCGKDSAQINRSTREIKFLTHEEVQNSAASTVNSTTNSTDTSTK